LNIPVLKLKGIPSGEWLIAYEAWALRFSMLMRTLNLEIFLTETSVFISARENPRPVEIIANTLERPNAVPEWVQPYIAANAIVAAVRLPGETQVNANVRVTREGAIAALDALNALRLLALDAWKVYFKALETREDECWTTITFALDDDLLLKYKNGLNGKAITHPSDIWKLMHDDFHRNDVQSRADLSQQFDNLTIEKGESFENFGIRIRQLSTQMLASGSVKTEEEIKQAFYSGSKVRTKALMSLNSVFSSDDVSKNLEHISKKVQTMDKTFAAKMIPTQSSNSISSHKVLSSKFKKSRNDKMAKKSGGGTGKSGTKTDKSHIECFKCHEKGHYANQCPNSKESNDNEDESKAKRMKGDSKVKINVTRVIFGDVSELILNNKVSSSIKLSDSIEKAQDEEQFVFDSGAESSVIKSVHQKMSDLVSVRNVTLEFGNGSKIPVTRKGTIGNVENVYINSSVNDNILSITSICDAGRVVVITDSFLYVLKSGAVPEFNGKDIELRVPRIGNLYKSKVNDVMDTFCENFAEMEVDKED
jgi:hypothetical protein